jgi:hypothetical protein
VVQKQYFLLRKIDDKTGAFSEQFQFDLENVTRLCELIGVEKFDVGAAYILEAGEFAILAREFGIPALQDNCSAEILNLGVNAKFNTFTHTGKELDLMLQRKKPLAAFVEVLPNDRDLNLIPEHSFAPHVADGTISRFDYFQKFNKGNGDTKLHRVLYALAGEEWRFRAHEMLWRLADEYGWSQDLEKIEGFLLGYEVETDPFFLDDA